MYRILIVDDEKFIRRSICNRMQWEQFGIEVAGEAANGQEALELIGQLRPQIVLVDIRMPVMDGIAFISEAKRRYPQIYYIIMSAYNDFEYAKKAIQLGVEDYILKPVKISELEAVLGRIVHELNQKRLTSHLLRAEAGGQEQPSFLGEQIEVLAFYVDCGEETGRRMEEAMQEALGKTDDKVILYHLENYSMGDCCIFLINGNHLKEEIGRNLVEAVWDCLGDIEGVAALSEIMEKDRLRQAVTSGIRLLTRKLFYPERKILTVRQRADEVKDKKHRQQLREKMNYLHRQNVAESMTQMENGLLHVVELLVNRENSIWTIEKFIVEILILLKKVSEGAVDDEDYFILFHGVQGRDYLLRYQTEKELKCRLEEVIRNCFGMISQHEDEDAVTSIRQYIRENYQSDLNAAQIARKFYLNASYLSTLFKEKTGMNMGAYIEGVRMEKAKEFLKDTEWPVTDIATRCGYSDSNYFTKVFKKYTGATPRQFREKDGCIS